jgi:hypothetical protein
VFPREWTPFSFIKVVMKKSSIKLNKKAFGAIFPIVTLLVMFSASFAYAAEDAMSTEMIIKLVNEARSANGIGKLEKNDKLVEAAKKKAEDMFKDGYFAHTSPAGVAPWYWFDESDYDYIYAGENLAINFKNAQDQQNAWMKSDLHRKNILNDKYEEIGVASMRGMISGNISVITVQMFGTSVKNQTQAIAKEESPKDEPVDVSEETGNQQVTTKPVVLSVVPSLGEPPSSSRYYAGIIAVGMSLFAFLLVAFIETRVALRKKKIQQSVDIRV